MQRIEKYNPFTTENMMKFLTKYLLLSLLSIAAMPYAWGQTEQIAVKGKVVAAEDGGALCLGAEVVQGDTRIADRSLTVSLEPGPNASSPRSSPPSSSGNVSGLAQGSSG